MAQDFDSIPPTTLMSDVRQKILNRDEAHSTWFLGASEPATMYAGMPWIDSSGGTPLWKVRNAANTNWYTFGSLETDLAALLVTGGSMAGDILLQGDPTNALHPATKQYMDARSFINKGKVWISHGNNVITFDNAHSDNNYLVFIGLVNTPMGGVETRGSKHTKPMEFYSINKSTTKAGIRINGGFGFTSGGYIAAQTGTTQRFDDIANTHTTKTAATARFYLAGYSLNGFGFSSGGYIAAVTGITERFDDTVNTHTGRTAVVARYRLQGYTLNGKGFTTGGNTGVVVGTTQRFDDVANTQTGRAAIIVRQYPGCYAMNNKGFVSGGEDGGTVNDVERFDDDGNAYTGRAACTARWGLTGYSLNGLGFTSCGDTTGVPALSGVTQRFDDDANNHTARLAAIARYLLAGYALNGFGFTTCGRVPGISGETQRFDDDANTHTARAAATARDSMAGYATNEYFINYITYNI